MQKDVDGTRNFCCSGYNARLGKGLQNLRISLRKVFGKKMVLRRRCSYLSQRKLGGLGGKGRRTWRFAGVDDGVSDGSRVSASVEVFPKASPLCGGEGLAPCGVSVA